ncbi:MAG: glycosyltransferase family 4 protein [Exilispira sp.]|jgi:glycosyltransferase involved in cell wall biosynthesis|nr:glycosyltransferase family 4 protein [Exilispira sp.]
MTNKLCHLTSVHLRNDTRIFLKECRTLSNNGFDVSLIVSDGKLDEILEQIKIFDIGKPKNRIERILKTTKKIYKKALEIDADIYHFHDPELIPIGLKLKKLGKKVIYDVHEDLPRQLINKSYLNKFILKLLAFLIEKYENYSSKRFDYIITATPYIRDRFVQINKNTIDINNYPILNEFYNIELKKEKDNNICYVGGITRIRGIIELIKAIENLDVTFHLAGDFENEEFKKGVLSLKGWKKVKYYGFTNREKVKEIFSISKIGVVTLFPTKNYLVALPIKLFEYMSASLPVIASNFPLWKEIVEGNNCGICVDPTNINEIAKAIEYLITNPEEAKKMGENGRKAVLEKYNWEKEEEKLINVYKTLMGK